MERYTNTILNKQGKPVAGAVVTVTTYPGNEPAVIYSADGGQPVESVSSDENGRFGFYAADGHYNLSISGKHVESFTITDVVLNDPNNDLSPAALQPIKDDLDALQLPDYAALRAYRGPRKSVYVTGAGIAGMFVRDDADTASADNGGTVIVAGNKRFKRAFEGGALVEWFGANGDWNGATGFDNSTAFEKALGSGLLVRTTPGKRYRLTRKLSLLPAQALVGMNGDNDLQAVYATELVLDHTDVGVAYGSQASRLDGFKITRAQATAADVATVSLANSSFGRLRNCRVGVSGGIGLLYSGGAGEACYFNERTNVSVFGTGTAAIRYTGANCTVNRAFGGKITMPSGDGIQYEASATENTDFSVNIEGCTAGNGLLVNSGGNRFIFGHIENCQTGVQHNVGGMVIAETGMTAAFAGQVQEAGPGKYLSRRTGRFDPDGTYEYSLRTASIKMGSEALASAVRARFDLETGSATSLAQFEFFRNTAGTGRRFINAYCQNSSNVSTKMWGVTNNAQDGVYTMDLGEAQIGKQGVVPEGVSYSPKPVGSIAMIRKYDSKWGAISFNGEVWAKVKDDTATTGFRMLQTADGGATANRPAGLTAGHKGYMWFDDTLGKPIWWNGSAWKDATGATV